MNRKMMRFALAGKCGCFTDSGDASADGFLLGVAAYDC